MRDVEVLAKGMEQFAEIIQKHTGLSIFSFLTLSSIADAHLKNCGAFEGVCEIGGVCRAFIQKCIVGGRVMCANNEKISSEECIDDFDAVSLYPSAMVRLAGLPTGKPSKLNARDIQAINNGTNAFESYFVKVRVLSVGKHYRFPLQSIKDSNGIR